MVLSSTSDMFYLVARSSNLLGTTGSHVHLSFTARFSSENLLLYK